MFSNISLIHGTAKLKTKRIKGENLIMNNFKKWLAYTTAVTLMTATLGFTTLGKQETEIAYASTNEEITLPEIVVVDSTTPSDKLETLNDALEEKKKIEAENEKKRLAEEKKRLENISTYYKVNAEYLNVRKQSNNKSTIIDVLTKNYIVQIDGEEKSGWVKLKTGGFVSAKYITHLKDKSKAEAEFKTQKKTTPVFTSVVKEKKSAVATTQTSKTETTKSATTPVKVTNVTTGILAPSNVSAQTLENVLAGTNLSGIGQALVQVEKQYGINAFFTLAVAKLESGNGNSRIAKDKNNLFGMNAVDSNPYHAAFYYDSKSSSVLDFGNRLYKNYISQGLTTLELINTKYSSSGAWASKVRAIMHGDINKISY